LACLPNHRSRHPADIYFAGPAAVGEGTVGVFYVFLFAMFGFMAWRMTSFSSRTKARALRRRRQSKRLRGASFQHR